MIVMLKTHGLHDRDAVRALLAGTQALGFEAPGREATYSESPVSCTDSAPCAYRSPIKTS